MPKHLPNPDFFIGKPVPGLNGYFILEHKGSGGNAHVFRAHSDELNQDTAVKVIPRENLKDNWKNEFLKANTLRSRMVVTFYHFAEIEDKKAGIDCIVAVSNYVNGISLKKYIIKNKKQVQIRLIFRLLRELFSLLHEMKEANISHGDLHSGNVLIESQPTSLVDPDYSFMVTDFAVTSATDGCMSRDDYEQLSFILKQLLTNVDYQAADPKDRFTYNILHDHFLARHLFETNKTLDRFARNPKALFNRLNEIDSDFMKQQTKTSITKLNDPFDYLSCELFGEEHSLLRSLYSNHFLGLSDIEGRNNLMLTGPRGCGKSTVFKSLSLRHRIMTDNDSPEEVKYFGVYYRCDDLYFSFPRYKSPKNEEAYNLPMHFITSTLLYELIDLISIWSQKYFQKEINEKELVLSKKIATALDIPESKKALISCLRDLTPFLQKQRERASIKQRFIDDPKHSFGYYFGPEVLLSVADLIKKHLSFLEKLPFFFFIDDFSSPKITIPLQKNMNRLFMQRNPYCFFKMSTESPVSYARSDIDGKAFVENREYFLLNLGLIYTSAKTREKLIFVEDIFNRRLRAVPEYPARDFEDLVGSIPKPNYNQAAREIRQKKRIRIWGKESITAICTGDIHTAIDLVRRMVSKVGGRDKLKQIDHSPKISQGIQTHAIREQAGDFLKGLRDLPEGEHLVEIVTAFGNVAYSYLKFKNSRNEKSSPPWQAHRIEPFERLSLTKKAREYYNELLRFSVFIEDVKGKSIRGKVVPRLFLRRMLIPHFNLTFSRRDSVSLENNQIELLLINPKEFEKNHRLKSAITINNQKKIPGF